MRTAICMIAALCGAYLVISGLWIARAGAVDDIPQLAATGVAELIVALTALLGAGLVFWNRWVALAMFAVSALWSACVAIIYFDDTIWIWCGISIVLIIGCIVSRRRNKRHREGTKRERSVNALQS
ncbi:hypothetical protein [Alicyclobacillus acidoterrestris]|uniref:Uncharacterized protein n=1 Tax=Alicyclobacillus acidoterrestris (strain ATCC 49025 / DSM 3922 / CIP 106132 / NCIMB 13137 / GD3B) TaxID=1356854 RepID=T0BXX1_ALIAG|nr:hypothetical protein [Alicyclobacillus acidoterrestris]EPZ48933.1 hypothetical protein N007_03595 [Alicyclobacillus acidoterrestris ATCC 49025]UNO47465.1 hypothetical protein K1I37_12170 [Alicyclobacillus acidoterrestris]